MRRISQDGLSYYQFELFDAAGQHSHGVFTRQGGVSRPPYDSLNVGLTVGDEPMSVQTNRTRMALALGARDEDTHTTWQIHGADVVVARGHARQAWPPPQADGIITQERDLPLVMRFADCVPLLFVDPVKQVVGLAHAGWRGTVAGAGPATVKTMEGAFGCRPEDILAGIGPSIGPCCYEIGPEVVDQIEGAFGTSDGLIHHPEGNRRRSHLDLWAANELALRRAGVCQIEVAGMCTASTTGEFFSHRAEAGHTGRFGAMIVLRGGVTS